MYDERDLSLRRLRQVHQEMQNAIEDIANYLGLTAETVSRTLPELNEGRVVSFSGPRRSTLLKRERLAAMNM